VETYISTTSEPQIDDIPTTYMLFTCEDISYGLLEAVNRRMSEYKSLSFIHHITSFRIYR